MHSHFKVRISGLSIKDSYVANEIELLSKKQGFDRKKLSLQEKFKLEEHIIKDLLENYSDVDFDNYTSVDYSVRCKIAEQAINSRNTKLIQTIKEKFNPQLTQYSNLFIIDINLFEEFVDQFNETSAIDWTDISKNPYYDWSLDTIDKGKFVLDWFELQLNKTTSKYFDDFDVIKRYEVFLNWEIISCDTRLNWTPDLLSIHKNRLHFSTIFNERIKESDLPFINRCFINFGQPAGISCNSNLNEDLIIQFKEFWDWELLSSNPAILKCNLFKLPLFQYLNLNGLSHNRALSLNELRELKKMYNSINQKNGYTWKFNHEGIEKNWNFNWKEGLNNSNVVWNESSVLEFNEIASENSAYGGNGIDLTTTKNHRNNAVKIKLFVIVEYGIPTMHDYFCLEEVVNKGIAKQCPFIDETIWLSSYFPLDKMNWEKLTMDLKDFQYTVVCWNTQDDKMGEMSLMTYNYMIENNYKVFDSLQEIAADFNSQ